MHLARRAILAGLIITAMIGSSAANAAERMAFEAKAFQVAQEAGKSILVHVTAPWCGECKIQKPIVANLADQPEFKSLTIFEVDFDTQKDALRALRVPKQSTLITFKGKAETGRSVGVTRREGIRELMNKAI